jgi:DNA-binding MarR family transcriptional regulator
MENLDTLRAQGQQSLSRKLLAMYRNYQSLAAAKYAASGYQGLSLAHTFMIANIDDSGTRIIDLAARMGTTKQFAGRLVQELAARGMVETTPDPTDRRAILVRGTASGWQFLASACAARDEIEREYQALLGDTLMRDLVTAVDRLADYAGTSAADVPHELAG